MTISFSKPIFLNPNFFTSILCNKFLLLKFVALSGKTDKINKREVVFSWFRNVCNYFRTYPSIYPPPKMYFRAYKTSGSEYLLLLVSVSLYHIIKEPKAGFDLTFQKWIWVYLTKITAKLILIVAHYDSEMKKNFHSKSSKLALNGFFHLFILLKNIRFASCTKRL